MAKSKSTAMNLSSHAPTSSATGKLESRRRRNSKSDAAAISQARLEDAYLGGLMDTATVKPVATKEESGDVDLSESETGSDEDVTWKPVAYITATEKPHASSESDCQGGPKAEKDRMVTQSTRVSSHSSSYGISILDRERDVRTRT